MDKNFWKSCVRVRFKFKIRKVTWFGRARYIRQLEHALKKQIENGLDALHTIDETDAHIGENAVMVMQSISCMYHMCERLKDLTQPYVDAWTKVDVPWPWEPEKRTPNS